MCARTGTDLSGALAALAESSQLLQSPQESMSPQQYLTGSALVAMTTAEVLDGLGRDDEVGLHRELAKMWNAMSLAAERATEQYRDGPQAAGLLRQLAETTPRTQRALSERADDDEPPAIM
jgi:hypothetical protein